MSHLRRTAGRMALLLLAGLLVPGKPGSAVELESIEVTKQRKVYTLSATSIVAAPRDFVFRILLDFDHFHRLSGGMVTTRFLPPEDNGVLVGYTLVNSCAWIFCKRFEKVERMWPEPERSLVTVADPDRSDFVLYTTHWRLEDVPGGTRLRFDATMQPDFWVPPLLGLWAVKRKLTYTALEMGQRVEYLHATGTPLADLPATARE